MSNPPKPLSQKERNYEIQRLEEYNKYLDLKTIIIHIQALAASVLEYIFFTPLYGIVFIF